MIGQTELSLEKRVGALFKNHMVRRGFTDQSLAEKTHQTLGLSISATKKRINLIGSRGKLMGTFSSNPNYPALQLYRLSVLLHYVGVEEDLPIVEELKEAYPMLEYPPPEKIPEEIARYLSK